ncbi:MAG TPA: hypothetical protein VFS21_33255 [Roseiflexaceae bacterium]|nr:hypothetical protein [Roseiflexaceae bacterium]
MSVCSDLNDLAALVEALHDGADLNQRGLAEVYAHALVCAECRAFVGETAIALLVAVPPSWLLEGDSTCT